MVRVAAFCPRNPGSNPGQFIVLNSNKKLSATNNTSVWYSSKYCNSAMGDTLVGGYKQPLKDALANLETIYRIS